MLNVCLPIIRILTDKDAVLLRTEEDHYLWLVANQECELSSKDSNASDAVIELRPVFPSGNPASGSWGIRSRIFRVTAETHLLSEAPRLHVSSSFLTANISRREPMISDDRATALKTWLGLRYDRPAVPPEWVSLAKNIAESLKRGRAAITDHIHDVLIQFSDDTPPYFDLFAVITDGTDEDAVREWMAGGVLAIPNDLGIPRNLDAGTRAQASLELMETSYSADLSQITWRGDGPTGAI